MADFFLRTESIKDSEIKKLSVINKNDTSILSALISSEPCIIEGSRGTGKSFLMKLAEQKIIEEKKMGLPVFVSFNASSLLNTHDHNQFYHWMFAISLKALINRLRNSGYIISSHAITLLSNDEKTEAKVMEDEISKIIKQYENSYKGRIDINPSILPEIEDVKEAISKICIENSLERIYFFFDEAAHVFRPEQQRQFFNLFKDLRSSYITCNAAIYPGVTFFGDSFEIMHDCVYKIIERDIREDDYIDYFKQIVTKQADENLVNAINKNMELFNTLALSCGGNPRILLKTIMDLKKFNTSAVNDLIKIYYGQRVWSEHTELGEKYRGHKLLIDWGRDFIENNVIRAIENYNNIRKSRGDSESTIYFWVHKDCPETVKEALRLLSYTGIVRKVDSNIRATRSEIGSRYEVKYGCILSLSRTPTSDSKDLYNSLSIKKFPEFGRNHESYSGITNLEAIIGAENDFNRVVKHMLDKPISVLQNLSDWQKRKLIDAGIETIEQLHQNSEESLIAKIYNVGSSRARLIKNAATAELLEYLSG
jgi:hypothetical protein